MIVAFPAKGFRSGFQALQPTALRANGFLAGKKAGPCPAFTAGVAKARVFDAFAADAACLRVREAKEWVADMFQHF